MPEGVAPGGQQARAVAQFQRADAGVVVVAQGQTGVQFPGVPPGFIRKPRDKPLICNQDQPVAEAQARIQVNFQRAPYVL